MKILVIDDMVENLQSARETLAGHDLTTCGSISGAMELLRNYYFEVVLTDMMMPIESSSDRTGFVAYGYPIVMMAVMANVPFVAVVSRINPMVIDLDMVNSMKPFLGKTFTMNSSKVMYLGSHPFVKTVEVNGKMELIKSGKDWSVALERLLSNSPT